MILLETDDLSKHFGANKALNNVTTSFLSGNVYGLLGPNGSGKSTFMKTIAGLFYPSQGLVKVLGEPQSTKSKSFVAYMTTEDFIYPHLSIRQVGKYFQDFFQDFSSQSFESLIDSMNLSMDLKVSDLSSGMHSKLKLAATLARDAKIILLDEPLNGIDVLAREDILSAIAAHAKKDNCLLISSHLIEEMELYLSHALFIHSGNIKLQGEIEELTSTYEKSLVDLYKEVYRHA